MKADRQVVAINREITTAAVVLSIPNPHSTAATTASTVTAITVSMQQCVHPTM